MTHAPHARPGFTLTDLLACAAIVALLAATLGAAGGGARETANRIRCAQNLRQISQALLLYSNENNGQFRRALYKAGEAPNFGTPYAEHPDLGPSPAAVSGFDPKSPARPAVNDVTAALFLLLRTQDVTPKLFVCPTTDQTPWDFGGGANTAQNWVNWRGAEGVRRHLGYSFQNAYPSVEAVERGFKFNNTLPADFAVLSDMNPGGAAVLKVRPDSPPDLLRAANSGNHGGDGQNVAYGDGHVEFRRTPLCGPAGENIFTYRDAALEDAPGARKPAANAQAAGIVGSPFDARDCLLLPTAEQVKLKRVDFTTRPADMPAMTNEEAESLAKQADAIAAESAATSIKAKELAERLRGQ